VVIIQNLDCGLDYRLDNGIDYRLLTSEFSDFKAVISCMQPSPLIALSLASETSCTQASYILYHSYSAEYVTSEG